MADGGTALGERWPVVLLDLEFILLVDDLAELGVLVGDGGVTINGKVFVSVVASHILSKLRVLKNGQIVKQNNELMN